MMSSTAGDAPRYATEFNQALAGAFDAGVLLAACWPTAGPGSVEDRADRAAKPRLDPTADRAERAFHAVEPENRLVARSLEARWEARLDAMPGS
jgi:hypothetical protein